MWTFKEFGLEQEYKPRAYIHQMLIYTMCLCFPLSGGEDNTAVLQVDTVKVNKTQMTRGLDIDVMDLNLWHRFNSFPSLMQMLLLQNLQVIIVCLRLT